MKERRGEEREGRLGVDGWKKKWTEGREGMDRETHGRQQIRGRKEGR